MLTDFLGMKQKKCCWFEKKVQNGRLIQRALMWLNLFGHQAVKNAFFAFAFLAIFWAYIRQPDNHIGWATLLFISIYPTNQSLKFSWKKIENWGSWKFQFFWVGHFEFFQKQRHFFLLHHHEKQSIFKM